MEDTAEAREDALNEPEMLELTAHRAGVEGDIGEAITIRVMDEPGPGGAYHEYWIHSTNDNGQVVTDSYIWFQKGGFLPGHGPNGPTIESLLAICQHRLECFQAGPYPCDENKEALVSIEDALDSLHARTRDRARRGVEGQDKP